MLKENYVIYLTKCMKTNSCVVVTGGTFDMDTVERITQEPDLRQTKETIKLRTVKTTPCLSTQAVDNAQGEAESLSQLIIE